MRLIIVRHADPDYINDSLTEKGFCEAKLLAERFESRENTYFYCSPLGRAQRTAEPVLKKLGAVCQTLDWLQEFPGFIIDDHTGEKRIPWDLMPSFWTTDDRFYDKEKWITTEIMQSGDVQKVYADVCKNLDELLERHGYKRNGNTYEVIRENRDTVVFFCHFGIECVLLSHILGVSPLVLWQGFVALPSSVTMLVTEERQQGTAYFRCNRFGDLSHLYAAGQEPSFAARFCENYSESGERH